MLICNNLILFCNILLLVFTNSNTVMCYVVVLLTIIMFSCFCYVGLYSYSVGFCLVMRVCTFLILLCTDMFSLLKWHQDTLKFTVFTPTPASLHIYLRTQPTHSAPLFGYNADDPQRFLHPWHTQHRNFLALTMHQSQSVSHNTSQPYYLPVYATVTIHACIQVQRKWPKAFPTALFLLPSGLYSIIISHTHIMIHTT